MIALSTPYQEFFVLVILSVVMATIGLLQNNVAIIIGSMLIAPVLYPIMGMSMGIVMVDKTLFIRSADTFGRSILIGVLTTFIITFFIFPPGAENSFGLTSEILLRIQPSITNVVIAIIAGLASSLAFAKPSLNETLPGAVISVALIPPLSVIGIGLAIFDLNIASKALGLLLINILGISFACIIIFSVMNLYVKKNVATAAIEKEDKELYELCKLDSEDPICKNPEHQKPEHKAHAKRKTTHKKRPAKKSKSKK